MPWDPNLQNNVQAPTPYSPSGYEKTGLRKLLLIVFAVLVVFALAILIVRLMPESPQSKYTKAATAAARKQVPDAKVNSVNVAGGFAIASVRDPSASGQASAGSTTIFKVNKDGSMVQLAKGSSFGPLDLLGLGIPLATQAKLAGTGIGSVKQNLANQCGYEDGALGFDGFDGSFSPGGWQIDSATLNGLEQRLSAAIGKQNVSSNPVICVIATQKNSDAKTDKTTYISTFTLQVQFITGNGTLTTHTVTFAIGPNYYRNYTLDGQNI